MSTVTHDVAVDPRTGAGLGLALLSALSFGLSGTLAAGLYDVGWSTGGILLVRIGIGVLALSPLALVALRGRWHHVRAAWRLVLTYGVLAAAGAQFCYFSAVQHMAVGPALLIEYTAPAAIVAWLWLRHGQRPARVTVAGVVLAVLGLMLVLDVVSGADLSPVGVAWAVASMIGCAAYFLINADDSTGIPPLALAWLGLVVGFGAIGLLALADLIPVAGSTGTAAYAGTEVAWWVPLVLLGLVTCAVAYGTGVAAGRLLGSRLSSFVALTEVLAACVFAWLLVDERLSLLQVLGGVLVLGGVVAVKLGERDTAAAVDPVVEPLPVD